MAYSPARGEGSRDLITNGGSRPFLNFRNDFAPQTSVASRTIVKVFAQAGETIAIGSSAVGVGAGQIDWRAPDGSTGTGPLAVGLINDLTEELAGPAPNPGGFTPYVITVGVGQTGIWEIDIVSPDPSSTTNPSAIGANSAWTQGTDGWVAAWDVQVRSSGSDVNGRVYVNNFAMDMGGFSARLNSELFVLTIDGFRYRYDTNGVQPFRFNLFANNKGFRDGTGNPLYQSVDVAGSSIHNPDSLDTSTDITHKMFINRPDATMPSSALTPAGGTTWLYSVPVAPTATNFIFTGIDGTPSQAGSGLGGNFTFDATGVGSYTIQIDLNNNAVYTDPIDVTLTGPATPGPNTAFWDGLDGLGTPAVSSGGVLYSATITVTGGEVHFPYLDAEANTNGIILERENGVTSPDFTIFYDDTPLTGGSALPPTGQNSSGGGHIWTGTFGNNRGINTWSLVPGATVVVSEPIAVAEADLEMVSKTHAPAVVSTGSPITYTFVAENHGPDTVGGATVSDSIPLDITGLTLTSATTSGSASVDSSGFNANIFNASVTMATGSSVTFVIDGTVNTGTEGNFLSNTARIISSADVGDLDDLGRTGAGNNNATDTLTVVPGSDIVARKSGPATVAAGGNLQYTITVRNDGPSVAANVAIADTLPGAVAFVSASNGGGESGGIVTWPPVASIAVGDSVVYSIDVTAPSTGILTNVVSATSSSADPDPSNNDGSNPSAQVVTTVNELADIVATKTGPPTVLALGNIQYAITVRNNGPSDANNVAIADTLPTNATFVSASNGGGESGGIVSWPLIATIANGDSVVYTVDVTAPLSGSLLNVVAANSATADPDSTNNNGSDPTGRVVTLVNDIADIEAVKSGPANVDAGGNIQYTITVRNAGPSAADSVRITDSLPATASFVTASNGGAESGGVVTWPEILSLAAGDSVLYTVDVTAPASGSLLNVVQATSSTLDSDTTNNDGSNSNARVTTTVNEIADVVALKSGPATVTALGNVQYTITVRNDGPSDAANVAIADTLPSGAAFVGASNGGSEIGGIVTWPALVTLANGDSVVYTVDVTAPATGSMLNVASATSTTADPDSMNNDGSDPGSQVVTLIGDVADVEATKSGPSTVQALGNIQYTITVRNNGPSPADSVVVQDLLPATTMFVAASNGGTESVGTITWPIVVALAAGDSVVYTVDVTAPADGLLLNVVSATTTTPDSDPSNNDGSDSNAQITTNVIPLADVVVSKNGPANVDASANIQYSLTIQNDGPSTAAAISVTDTLPVGVTFVSASNGGTESSGVVSWPVIASMANGANIIYTVDVTAPSTGTITNIASAFSTTADPDSSNNDGSDATAQVVTTINERADIVALKSGPSSIVAGGNIQYTITVRNGGPSDASNITIADTLPSNATFVAASNGGGESSGIVTWPSLATLANGDSVVYTVDVTAPASGSMLNVVAATSTTTDPDAINNDGSDPGSQVVTLVTDVADVEAIKSGPATADAGMTFQYTITVTNTGPSTATSVAINDALPPTATFVSASNGGVENAGVVTWPVIATLANGANVVYTVDVTAPANGSLLNVVSATANTIDPNTNNNDGSNANAQVVTTVNPLADVVATKSGPPVAGASSNIQYNLVVRNNGPSDADSILIRDTLPPTATFVTASNGGTESAGVVTWPIIPTLANGDSVVYTVDVTAPASGTLLNVVSSTSTTTDSDNTNNDGSDPNAQVVTNIAAVADVVATKAGPGNVAAGAGVTYTITVQNNGPSDAANVVVTDTLPANATFLSASNSGTESGGVVTWPVIPTLTNGANVNYSVDVTAPTTGTLLNVVAANSNIFDPDSTNNNGSDPGAQVVTTVDEVADIVAVKTGPATAVSNEVIQYTITVRNNGPSPAASVAIVDTLPANASFIAASNNGAETSGIVTWPTIPSIADGDSVIYTVDVMVPQAGAITNVVTASTITNDPDPTNNDGTSSTSQVVTTITAVADVVVQKIGPATASPGDTLMYTITVRNDGPIDAASVTVTDTLPTNAVFLAASNGGTESSGVVTWPVIPTLVNGDSIVYTVDVDAPALGNYLNIAAARSATADPDSTNNNGSTAGSQAITNVLITADLFVEKTSSHQDVEIAEVLDYMIHVENITAGLLPDIVVVDDLPAGFKYVGGTAMLDGTSIADPMGSPGRHLEFPIGDIPGNEMRKLTYRVRVGPGAELGDGINQASAGNETVGVTSNIAAAKVNVRPGVFTDEGIIAGKVYVECEQQGDDLQSSEELGIPGVRVVLEDGSSVITDVEGKYHFYGVSPALHVVRIDVSTLPEGAEMLALSNRHAGDGMSAFADVFLGELHRTDFAEGSCEVDLIRAVKARRELGEVSQGMADSRLPGVSDKRDLGIGGNDDKYNPVLSHKTIHHGNSVLPPTPDVNPNAWRTDSTFAPPVYGYMDEDAPPSGASEDRRAVEGYGDEPDRGDEPLFVNGLLEGRIDLRSVASGELGNKRRDGFMRRLTELQADGNDGQVEAAFRAGLYAKGTVKEDYLLTLRLDSELDEGARFLRDIRPDELYGVYGDASVKQFDAQSTSRFYGRIDKERSYLMFGDYGTGQSLTGERGIGAYSRTLNGFMNHIEKDRAAVNTFASRNENRQVVDEIPGAGISGPYTLSRNDGLLNSERVDIITRDRNHPAVVVHVQPQSRFTDYTVEPFTGRLIFKHPVPTVDENFNPVSIQVTYEVEQGGDKFWVFGFDGQAKPHERIEIGAGFARDDNPFGRYDLGSINTTLDLGRNTLLLGEAARSDSAGTTEGRALRLELRHNSDRYSGRAFYLNSDETFQNPSSRFGTGRQEFGLRGNARIDELTRIVAEATHTEDRVTNGDRNGGRISVARRLSDWISAQAGYRYAKETTPPASPLTIGASPNETSSFTLSAAGTLPRLPQLSAGLEYEQDLRESEQRRFAVRTDYRVFERTRLYARHEFLKSLAGSYALNTTQAQNITVFGIAADYLRESQVFSEYRARDAFNGRESHAVVGLRNSWQLSEGVRINTSLERLSPLTTTEGEATSLTGALEYTKNPLWRGHARVEYRNSRSAEHVFGSLGYARKISRDFTFLGSSMMSHVVDGAIYERSRLGVAYRDTDDNQWNVLARYENKYEKNPGFSDMRRMAHVLSGHANVQASDPLVLRGQAATKFVNDRSAGITLRENAHLLALRGTYDLTQRFDVGGAFRTFFSGSADSHRFGIGGEAGYLLRKNLRVAAGYNVFGFRDSDIAEDEYTDHGFYIDMGFKFGEDLFKRGQDD